MGIGVRVGWGMAAEEQRRGLSAGIPGAAGANGRSRWAEVPRAERQLTLRALQDAAAPRGAIGFRAQSGTGLNPASPLLRGDSPVLVSAEGWSFRGGYGLAELIPLAATGPAFGR